MQSLAYITLDLQAVNSAVVVTAKQNDRRARRITAQLRDGDVPFVPAAGAGAVIRYAKPDGTAGFYDVLEDGVTPAYTIDGSSITITLCEQMLTVPGCVYVEINFYNSGEEKLTTLSFLLRVQASVLADSEIVSSDYYNVLTAMVSQAVTAAMEAASIAENLPRPSNASPAALGQASAGSSALYSRGDHVHPKPSAADIGAVSTQDVQYKIYNSVEDVLGPDTSGSATIAGVYGAMPAYSILIADASEFSSSERPASTSHGVVQITKYYNSGLTGSILYFSPTSAYPDYRMHMTSSSPYQPTGEWVSVAEIIDFGTFTGTAKSFTLPGTGYYLVGTTHSTGAVSVGLWLYSTSGSTFFNMGGGSAITLTGNGQTITAKSGGATVGLYAIKVR